MTLRSSSGTEAPPTPLRGSQAPLKVSALREEGSVGVLRKEQTQALETDTSCEQGDAYCVQG